jgi:hypothetical protein
MKPLLTLTLACLYIAGFSQAKVSWGEEFKMHRSSTDLTIVYAEKSGIYMEESHDVMKVGFFSSKHRKSGILVKLDGNMAEQYRNDFDKELKGKDYDRLFLIHDRLYLFATNYTKKDNSLHLYAAEIDKGSGSLKGDWQEIYAWQKNDKSEEIDYNITLSEDSAKVVLTGTYTGKSENRYEIKMMDDNLHMVGKQLNISNEFDPKTFQVQDFVYTSSGNAILIGRIYEYEEGRKKKDKNLLFKNYNIRIYDLQGKMIRELATDIDGKFLVTGKMIQLKNEMVLAAFYSNEKKRKEINGMMVQRFDPATGKVLVTTKKELNNALISEVEDDDDDKKKKKDKDDEEEGLVANLVFRNFYVTPDNGLVILAERYSRRVIETSSYSPGFGPNPVGTWNHNSYLRYDCGDIYMSKVSAAGNIDWLHVLPKSQTETIQLGHAATGNGIFFYSFFEPLDTRPFYAGFNSMAGKGMVHLFFNDNDRNADVLQPGKKIKRVTSFGSTSCYQVNLDMATGKYTRKAIFSNKDIPTSMPRLGSVMNNTMWVTGKEDRTLAKSKIAVGKIVCMD